MEQRHFVEVAFQAHGCRWRWHC